jgi:hypothetical protein
MLPVPVLVSSWTEYRTLEDVVAVTVDVPLVAYDCAPALLQEGHIW